LGTFEESRVVGRESRVAPSAVRPFGSAAASPASGRGRLLCIPPPQERGLIQLRIAHEPPYRRALRARRYLPPCGGTDRRSLSAFPPAGGPIGLRDRTDTSALGSGYRQTVAPPLGGVRLIRRIRREGGYPAVSVGFALYVRLRFASAQEPSPLRGARYLIPDTGERSTPQNALRELSANS